MRPMTRRPNLEHLEGRLAPATLLNPTTLRYTDVDGDAVTVHVSKGALALSNPGGGPTDDFTLVSAGLGQQLQLINFSDDNGEFAHANLTIAAKRTTLGGDGLVNIGFINSTGFDLGAVTVRGDLGRIDAGDANPAAPGLAALSVRSLGRLGTSTQVAGGSLISSVQGDLPTLTVATDMDGAAVNASGRIGSAFVGGSILGGSTTFSGRIQGAGGINSITVRHDLVASDQDESGKIFTGGNLGRVFLGGSLVGGTDGVADFVGQIHAGGHLGPVRILGDVVGNAADRSAQIDAATIDSIFIGGSLVGGGGSNSARVVSTGNVGAVTILGDIRGGAGNDSGKIVVDGSLAGLTVGGSLVGGSGSEETDPTRAGQVFAKSIGPVRIGGNLQGATGGSSARVASSNGIARLSVGASILGADGETSAEVGTAGVIGLIQVRGDVRGGGSSSSGAIFANSGLGDVRIGGSLVGGGGPNSGTVDTSGSIGRVTIGHDLRGGTALGNLSGTVSASHRIAGVTIGGSVYASTTPGVTSVAVQAGLDLGPVQVQGSLIGNTTNPVRITAIGLPTAVAPNDVAIQSVTVLGRVELADILPGYFGAIPISGDAQIGAVTVGGDWIASNLVAGVLAGPDGQFGTSDDALIGPGNPAIVARIASVTIGGQVLGTVGGADHYGFVAQQIGLFRVSGLTLPLHPGPGNDLAGLPVGATSDVAVREVA